MTPQEKAKDLVERYVTVQNMLDETTQFYWEFAQKCADIAVQGTLRSLFDILIAKDTKDDEEVVKQYQFYQEVRKEIKKYNG